MGSPARFYAPDARAEDQEVVLEGDELHHLRHVLRLTPGAEVSLFDGAGSGFLAELVSVERNEAVVRIRQREPASTESSLRIHLSIGMAKGEKLDLVIQKATELGVTAIHPVATHRADVKALPERSAAKLERWRRVALEACKQSGRTRIPEVHPPMQLAEFFALDLPGLRVVLSPTGGTISSLLSDGIRHLSMVISVGPEGGWDARELEQFRRHGFVACRLGPRILRVETAAIFATGLFQFLSGDLPG
ncbi:MAG TPA: 16S rRNA (uracil(1498)-N(3))-methyltransferase [Candidatus Polarisedimenticolia bacterium]|nr:16S rRNA (uracil(1498)-N(3))-methyltransferase [Candidatus Polarisedimenticolia bacterium]